MQDRKRLEEAISSDAFIRSMTSDLETLFELCREGEPVFADIESEMKRLRERLAELEIAMLLAGENDARSAIMTIHPGAGGTESQDWAEMLLRMYLRWAERKGFETVVTDRLEGEGAGIKSVTFEVNGENAYGLLQSEVGVHRLVRISPFDANARRHTSFASVFVYPQVDDEIKIDIRPEDLRVDTFRVGRRRRPARQPHGFGRPHDAPAHRHRGAVPERALAAQEPRQRAEAVARPAVRARNGQAARRKTTRSRPASWTSISAARFAATCWRPTGSSRTTAPSSPSATWTACWTATSMS